MTFRIQHAQRDGTKVIDVDGSYLHQKEQRLNATGITTLPLNPPMRLGTTYKGKPRGNSRQNTSSFLGYVHVPL